MTNEEITEGNKLIAEFVSELPNNQLSGYWLRVPDKELNRWVKVNDLKYHTSWDWIMPVVEKIEADGFIIHKDSNEFSFYNPETSYYIIQSGKGIQAAWGAVVQMMKCYRDNNQNK